jgi:hypothetical protein
MSPRTSRTDPRLVREVLAYAETNGPVVTARHFSIDHTSVYRWKQYRAQFGPAWPTDADIADYDAKAEMRAVNAARKRRYDIRVYLNRGPILKDATGSIRRLRALSRMGYTQRQIAGALGVSSERVSQFARGRHTHLKPETVKAIAAVYRQLCRAAPTGPYVDSARELAEQKGWFGPGAWDDATIDNPAAQPVTDVPRTGPSCPDDSRIQRRLDGDRTVRLHKGETAEVVRRLLAAGITTHVIRGDYGIKAERYIKVSDRQRVAA